MIQLKLNLKSQIKATNEILKTPLKCAKKSYKKLFPCNSRKTFDNNLHDF